MKKQPLFSMTSETTDTRCEDTKYRILSLDGGGAKGFYTIGVLKEIEGLLCKPLHEGFDLVFGTSTGSIIAALIVLGHEVDEIHRLYREHVTTIMKCRTKSSRSKSLKALTQAVFGDKDFTNVKTGVGIVATKWDIERPLIFKGSVEQAHGGKGTFTPGFGVSIADAVEASCSAHPFFKKKTVQLNGTAKVKLVDGGFCANNPSLYAITDACRALKYPRKQIRLISVGVGEYPKPKRLDLIRLASYLPTVKFLQKVLEFNTQSMDQLRAVLFGDIPTVRINESFSQPEMAADLLESNQEKLDLLFTRGRESFLSKEEELGALLFR